MHEELALSAPIGALFAFSREYSRNSDDFWRLRGAFALLAGFAATTLVSTAKFGCRPCGGLASLPVRFTESWGTSRERDPEERAATLRHQARDSAIPGRDHMLEGLRSLARDS
jgi:hypothetical protein